MPYNASLNLHFRGAANLRAVLADAAARFAIVAPSEVVVTGGSAGGLSTTLHTDAIGAALGARSIVGVPQCAGGGGRAGVRSYDLTTLPRDPPQMRMVSLLRSALFWSYAHDGPVVPC